MKYTTTRRSFLSAIAAGATAAVVAGLLAIGMPSAAFAATGQNFTVMVTTKSGAPLTGVSVYAVQVVDGNEPADDPQPKGKAVSHEAGFYSFTGASQLVAGDTYTLLFAPTGSVTSTTYTQFLGGASVIDRAQTFVVGTESGGISSLSTSLASNARISGVVKGSTGKVLKGAIVDADFYNDSQWYVEDEVTTSSKGAYSLTDLEPGSYKLEVYYPGETHAPIFSGGEPTFDAATALSVGLGSSLAANLNFPSYPGALSGVTEINGQQSLSKALPVAYPVTLAASAHNLTEIDTDRAVYGTRVNSRGSWSIKGLAPGDYVVHFFPWYYNEASGYLDGSSTDAGLQEATIWHVASATVDAGWSNQDITTEGSAITIGVLDHNRAPISGAKVLMQRVDEPADYYSGTTGASGRIAFGFSGKHKIIQPGEFNLTVIKPGGLFEPLQTVIGLGSDAGQDDAVLEPLIAVPGFSSPPAITGSGVTVGTTYDVVADPSRPDATLAYQWLRNGHPVYGANASHYTSRTGDIGTQLSVRVTASSFSFDDVSATAQVPGIVIADPNAPQLVSPPVLSPSDGSAVHAGTILSATPGVWDTGGLDYSYQWTEDGAPISDTANRYIVTAADIAHAFSVRVSATNSGTDASTSAQVEETVVPTEGGEATPSSAPLVTATTKGVKKGSERFTVAPGAWSGIDPQFSYAWQLGSTPIPSATGSSFTEVESKTNLAQPLRVTVSVAVAGFAPGAATVVARKASVALKSNVQPFASVDGSTAPLAAASAAPAETAVRVSDPGTWSQPADSLTYTYQWYQSVGKSAAKAIAGATSATYTPPLASIGDKLTVIETAHSSLWGNGVSQTVPAGTVANSNGLVNSEPAITMPTGTIYPNTSIAAQVDRNEWEFSDGVNVDFTWYECVLPSCTDSSPTSAFVAIPNSDSSTLAVPNGAAGGRLFLRANATKPHFVSAQEDSSVVVVDPNLQLQLSTGMRINEWYSTADGNYHAPAVDEHSSLTLVSVIDQSNAIASAVDYTYQVQVCSDECDSPDATWQPASGGTSFSPDPSYDPSVADYANGSGWARLYETANEAGYTGTFAISTPVKLDAGTYTTYHAYPGFTETAGDDSTSDTFTVTPVPIDGVSPTVQWYSGSEELPGLSQVVESPTQLGVPEYAVVTYDIPGYSPLVYYEVARHASPAAVTPAADSILGDHYGQTLTLSDANPWAGADYAGATGVVSYQWCLGQAGYPSTCRASSSPNYGLANPENVGYPVKVIVQYQSPLYPDGADMSETITMDGNLLQGAIEDSEPAPTLSWDGDLAPGVAVTVGKPDATPYFSTLEYTWQTSTDGAAWTTVADGVDNRSLSSAANIYVPTVADADKQIRVAITATAEYYAPLVETSNVATVGHGARIAEYAAPVVTGDARVGGSLSVDPGNWASDATVRIQWLLNGTAVPGATGTTYTPLATNVGDEVSVRVTASRSGLADSSDESNRKTIESAAAPTQQTPAKITGKGTTVSPLSVSTGSWSLGGLEFTYEWSDASGPIAGATASTLVLPTGDTVGQVSVTITATRSGYDNATVTVQ